MAIKSPEQQELSRLRFENRRLREENRRLSERISNGHHSGRPGFSARVVRKSAVLGFVALAVVLLFVGNMFFWAGNTVVKTDRYVETVQPLIRNPEIQTAIASYSTQQLFKSVDVEKVTEEALPPRATFLAPTIADQLQSHTDDTIKKLLTRPQFQARWDKAQKNAHDRFISTVKRNGSDGSISLNEFYQQISGQLKGTKLSFLANKPLPAKAGSIQLVQGAWLSTLQKVINNIDTWRTIAIALLLVSSVVAVWLSHKKRKTVILLGLLFSASMFVTLILIRVARELIAGKVDRQYAEAARQAAQTVFHPLAIQTATIFVLGLLVAFIAWISGPSKNAAKLTEKLKYLFGGKLHGALFSKENRFTIFLGMHKRVLQWAVVGATLALLLFIRLTPLVLLLSALLALVLVLVVEALSAEQPADLRSREV